MKIPGYYTSGEFARMAHVSIRTIRFYDKQNILKPSYVNESGARFYSDADFARLQQILLLKYLGFSLEDIRSMTINDTDYRFMKNSLNLQLKLVQDKIEQLQLVEKAIQDTSIAIEKDHNINWSQMLNLIHLTNMEQSLSIQYQNSSNISARINLHHLYAKNKQGWFPWIYEQCDVKEGMSILEVGCGNGALWVENLSKIPKNTDIVLSDISEGMIRDVRRTLGSEDSRFSFEVCDCHKLPFADNSFDLVIANHVLFYCQDIEKACKEAYRVLKPNGRFMCSTYGTNHMKEISLLVTEFDERITLSAEKLYERFGLENGYALLHTKFKDIKTVLYDDALTVIDAEPLIEYILSCHGNQNHYILDRYKEFRSFVERKTKQGFSITKEAGTFICKKNQIS
ncbi:MAG: methyltransferase domain-containing protein [Lachnospiraceae bacterium]|nr:methyltransferase domain-containing protein [Lachnospiraceae bacterium]